MSKSLRFEVLRRDAFRCRYCGAKAPDAQLNVDHVVPESLGGQGVPENLVTSCIDCNAGKGSTPPDSETVADVSRDAHRWASAIAQAASEMQARDASAQWLVDLWMEVVGSVEHVPLDASQSVIRFMDMGLPRAVVEEVFWVAVGARHITDRNRFAYFAGCCHRRIRELHERAAELVEGGDGA